MAPIIATLSVNSFLSSGGLKIPDQFDAMVIAAGSSTSGAGAGGALSFTNQAGQTNQGYSFLASQWDFTSTFTVTVGATAWTGGNSKIAATNSSGSLVDPAKMEAIGGGAGGNYDGAAGYSGGSGGGGRGYSGSSSGGSATGSGYGPYFTHQGKNGGNGARACCWAEYYGGGGGFSNAGSAASSANHGVGGAGIGGGAGQTQTIMDQYAEQFWLGVSDNSPYSGRFSRGWNHVTGTPNQPGDAGQNGIVAIRYLNTFDDPTVTGSPTFYDDTTNNKRIVVWTGAGTFAWS